MSRTEGDRRGAVSGAAVATDVAGNPYVTGSFLLSATFGAGEAHETTLVAAGRDDVFVARWLSEP